tara:strand:- start:195 stop:1181 length:987 start_codon:yes stop_codon:yes gene_type:complete
MSKAAELAALIGSQSALSDRNMIINGAMAVSERGTSFSAPNGVYTLDRMRCAQANSADTISQQTFTAGQTGVPGSPKNFLRFAFGAATANRVLETRIEDVYTASGQSITLSFYAKASEAHTSSIEMTQSFGSGGSSDVAFGTQNYDITTSFQRFEFALSCPSISGKTVGAGNYLSAAFVRSLSAGPSINVDIALLQLEIGEQATPFEHRSLADDLAMCQRYYYKLKSSSSNNFFGYAMAANTTAMYLAVPFPVEMRSNPTSIDVTAGSSGNIGYWLGGAVTAFTSIGISESGPSMTTLVMQVSSGLSAEKMYGVLPNGSGSIGFSSEL